MVENELVKMTIGQLDCLKGHRKNFREASDLIQHFLFYKSAYKEHLHDLRDLAENIKSVIPDLIACCDDLLK